METPARIIVARDRLADIVADGGEWALPVFERLEREVEALSDRQTAIERAQRIAAERRPA